MPKEITGEKVGEAKAVTGMHQRKAEMARRVDPSSPCQVLLSRVSLFNGKGLSSSATSSRLQFRQTAEAVMCGLCPNSPTATSNRTDGGMIWVSEWNALQHPVASAIMATVYSDNMLTSRRKKISCSGSTYKASQLRKFAISQANYVLGDNPMKLSCLVGYGDKYPQFVHHRGGSIPELPSVRMGSSDLIQKIQTQM